jgi:hypothetical protein
MIFTLQRLIDNGKSTTGEYILPDFKLISMEDTGRDKNHDGDLNDEGENKVWGKTRIPGNREYVIKLRESGSIHLKYKQRFSFHKGMLWLQDVPNFKDIYIHILNTAEESHGCPGVGIKKLDDDFILQSTAGYIKLYKYLLPYFEAGEEVRIKILDEE